MRKEFQNKLLMKNQKIYTNQKNEKLKEVNESTNHLKEFFEKPVSENTTPTLPSLQNSHDETSENVTDTQSVRDTLTHMKSCKTLLHY